MTTPMKSFRRQFIELFTGSTLAQVFSLVLMPVISRLYGPSDMGEYAIYVSISSILGLLSNCRLDMAVILAEDDEEASHLVFLGSLSALGGSLLTLAGLFLLGYGAFFSCMTALSVATIGGYQCFVTWHSRKRNYKILAGRSAGEKLVVLSLGIGLGLWGFTRGGLIAAQTMGLVFSFCYLLYLSRLPKWHSGIDLWHRTLRKFSDFPRKNAFSSILLSLSMFLPSILFAAYFDKTQLGHYNLATRLFDMPINLIGYTFSTVYYQHSSRISAPERLRLFWKTLGLLSLAFIPALLIVASFGPDLFSIVFGEVWRASGIVARWLAPLTVLRLLYISQSSLLLVGRKLNLDLTVSFSLFVAQIGGFFLGHFYFHSILGSVMCMSLLGIAVYTFGLVLIHRVLKPNGIVASPSIA